MLPVRKTIFFVSLILFSSLLFFSCQQEPDADFLDNREPETEDSTLLVKYVFLDTTLSAPFDTVSYTSFVYDASKRLINSYEVDKLFLDTLFKATYYYNGSDTLPYKKTILRADADGDLTVCDTSLYSYDHMGRLTDYSLHIVWRNSGSMDILNVHTAYVYTSYGADGRTEARNYSIPSGPVDDHWIRTHKIYNTIVNNCIQKQIDSLKTVSYDAGTGAPFDSSYVAVVSDFQYDNKPNPFLRAYRVSEPLYPSDGNEEWRQPHNLIRADSHYEIYLSSGSTGTGSFKKVNSYEYKTNGYPHIVREFDQSIAGNVYKMVCIYGR